MISVRVAVLQIENNFLLVFCRKDLCEARVKPEMSSNFQMMFPDIPPVIEFKFSDDLCR